jgi:hypothetical protein
MSFRICNAEFLCIPKKTTDLTETEKSDLQNYYARLVEYIKTFNEQLKQIDNGMQGLTGATYTMERSNLEQGNRDYVELDRIRQAIRGVLIANGVQMDEEAASKKT